ANPSTALSFGGATTGVASYVSSADQAALSWNVAAVADFADDYSNFFAGNYGILTTADQTSGLTSIDNANDIGGVALASAMANGTNFAKSVNGAAGDMTNYAANLSYTATSDTDLGYANQSLWGNNWGGILGFDNSAALGDNLGFFVMGQNSDASVRNEDMGGHWNLASTGDLTWNTAVTQPPLPTPLPPAIWLLGSAMVGLVGVSRRRKASV
ncbi:MAG: hypothetical protein R3240_06130, partial [Gammaproteobacteria bacterium]|nr:hypothetical protein [Gammaproteobacteria bacterium]